MEVVGSVNPVRNYSHTVSNGQSVEELAIPNISNEALDTTLSNGNSSIDTSLSNGRDFLKG